MIHTNTQNELLRISFHTNTSVSWTALALKGLGEVVLVRPWEWLFLLLGWTLESLIHLARGSSRPQCVVWTRNLMNNLVILLTIIRNRFHVTFVIISNQYLVFFLITSRLKPHFWNFMLIERYSNYIWLPRTLRWGEHPTKQTNFIEPVILAIRVLGPHVNLHATPPILRGRLYPAVGRTT